MKRYSTYEKKQISDARKFINKYFRLSYLDTKDNLPKKIGIIGSKYNLCYESAIELIFKLIRYRKKIRSKILREIKCELSEFEAQISNGESEAETIFNKFFIIEYYETENTLADALNSGTIDYCVVPSKIMDKESGIIEDIQDNAGLTGSQDMILSAAISKECDSLLLCHNEKNSAPSCIYTTELNKNIAYSSSDQTALGIKIVTKKHTKICYDEFLEDKTSAFICNGLYYSKLSLDPECSYSRINLNGKIIEFRLLKYKSYKEKDDNARPPSLLRRLKELYFVLWRKKYLKAIFMLTISLVLYVYSLSFNQGATIIEILPYFNISQSVIVSLTFSILIYILFSLFHYSSLHYMRLKKIKGFWLLYTIPTHLPNEVKEHDPHLYSYPRVVRIDFSRRKHLEFLIYMLNNEGLYLKSENFFLDAYEPKKGKIVITYSNNEIPHSKEKHGFINGISELDCEIEYDSSNLYEMSGNFFSKARLENGKLNYFRLADEDDFALLMASVFIPRER